MRNRKFKYSLVYVILLFILQIYTIPALAHPANDTLSVTTTGPMWDALRPGIEYSCLAETSGLGTNIIPMDSIIQELLIPGIINVTGTPGAMVRVGFTLPELLLPTAGIGHINVSFTNQSAALIDLSSGRPSMWFNPASPLDVRLDSTGCVQVWLVANLDVSLDAAEGDAFISNGTVEVMYRDSSTMKPNVDSSSRVSKDIEFTANISCAEAPLTINKISEPIIFSGLWPSVQYKCTTDSLSNILPISDPLNPEKITRGIFEIVGAPGAHVLVVFSLPDKLTPPIGFGEINMSYDTTSIRVLDPYDSTTAVVQWVHFPDTIVTVIGKSASLYLFIVGNPTVSPYALEGDTLYGQGEISVEYTGFKRRLSGISQVHHSVNFLATIKGSKTFVSSKGPASTPASFALDQNYPNPFNPVTKIRYHVPINTEVSLKVYNVLGIEVGTLVNGLVNVGEHVTEWDATGLPGGVYFYRLQAGRFSSTRKLLLVK